MNTLLAIRLMAAHYPTGLEGLALITGKSPEVLRKEIAGNQTNKLGLLDAALISDACISAKSPHCYAYVTAVVTSAGGIAMIPTEMAAPGCTSIQKMLADVVREASDVLVVGVDCIADSHVSDNDEKAIGKEVNELVMKIYELLDGVKAAHKAGQPK